MQGSPVLSWALTHEDVEAMTGPVPGQGWLAGDREAADPCEWERGAVSAYWSDAAGAGVR